MAKRIQNDMPPWCQEVFLAVGKYLDEGDGQLVAYDIKRLRDFGCNPGIARPALSWLEEHGFFDCNVVEDRNEFAKVWILSQLGAEYLHNEGANTLISDLLQSQVDSSELWHPLNLDRESADACSAFESVEQVIEAIQGDNGYAATNPEERETTLWSLNKGLEALRTLKPTKAVVHGLIITPLEYLVSKFTGAAIGQLAKVAITYVSKLLWS